jgi:pimeloyl-ACP methyl ester carboxylesterase
MTLVATAETSPRATAARTRTATPPIGRFYEVGDHRFALDRRGSGGPSVVFLPGAGLIGLDFLNIHEAIARVTTSVIYDRGGTGWSDAMRLPRSAADAAGELRALLEVAGVPGPYILVGHSLGGAYIRRFAQLFPGEVAGLLFIDPAHESYAAMPGQSLFEQVKMGLKALPALLDARRFYRPLFSRMYATWPEATRELLIDYHLGHMRTNLQEMSNLNSEVLPEIAAGGAAPAQPTIVLTAMGIDPFQAAFMPEAYLARMNERKAVFYSEFAALAPRGENRLVANAGHSTLHTDCPGAVIEALTDLIAWTR